MIGDRSLDSNLLTQWARLLLGSFSDAGVSTVVLSPGSRSTPFAAAALAHPALECRSIIDERDAAFYALGRAKADGEPVLVVCTSGTAGANYFPAVIEAEMSFTPLVILTADRPTELAHCHAPQTIDQIKLFGDHARAFFELGAPDGSLDALQALRRTAAQAVYRARAPLPGAVHLNARARKPLEPAASGEPNQDPTLEETVSRLLERPIVRAEAPVFALGREPEDALVDALRSHERGLIVCGPAPAAQGALSPVAAKLSRRTGYPLLVEAASQWRFHAGGGPQGDTARVGSLDALGRSPALRKKLMPEVILQLGTPPIARGWSQYLEACSPSKRFVIHPYGWQDPWSTASWMVPADLAHALPAILARLEGRPEELEGRGGSPWLEAWREAETLARGAVDSVLGDAGNELSEGLLARRAVEALPPGGGLALGNSLPIREVDAYAPPQAKSLAVWSQRGASGIDGVLAGAAGFASKLGRPTLLLIGDVSFLHSLSGLAAMRHLESPLAVLVVHNDGGRIFEQLPMAEVAERSGLSMDPWITPHGLDLEPAAQLYRLPFLRVATPQELEAGLKEALMRPGATILEARVPPGGAIHQNRRLWQQTDEAIARELSTP